MAEAGNTGRTRGRSAEAATAGPPARQAHGLIGWVQRNPKAALTIALGVGIAIGLSPRARRGLMNVMDRAGEFMG
jgi:hypothetical protein